MDDNSFLCPIKQGKTVKFIAVSEADSLPINKCVFRGVFLYALSL